jgi:hypothetical protein
MAGAGTRAPAKGTGQEANGLVAPPIARAAGLRCPADGDLSPDTTITEPETRQLSAGERKNVQLQQSAVVTLQPGAWLCPGLSDPHWQQPVKPSFVFIYDQPKSTTHTTVNGIALPRGLYHDLRIRGLNDWLIAHRVSSETRPDAPIHFATGVGVRW